MRVIAVDLPFIYVVVLKADGQEDGPLILDLRRFPLVEICTSVPEAILEFADMKLRSNYEHSLATAATEAAVEAKAEIVKCTLLADATNGEGAKGESEGTHSFATNRHDDILPSGSASDPRTTSELYSSANREKGQDGGDDGESTGEESFEGCFVFTN